MWSLIFLFNPNSQTRATQSQSFRRATALMFHHNMPSCEQSTLMDVRHAVRE